MHYHSYTGTSSIQYKKGGKVFEGKRQNYFYKVII